MDQVKDQVKDGLDNIGFNQAAKVMAVKLSAKAPEILNKILKSLH